jgi:hypothetical protein
MILRIEIYQTQSSRPKQRGRNDRAWLIPESEEERQRLITMAKIPRPTDLRGSSNIERDIESLRGTARAIDPEFKEEVPNIIRG